MSNGVVCEVVFSLPAEISVHPNRYVYVQVGATFKFVCTDHAPPDLQPLLWKHVKTSGEIEVVNAVAGSDFFIDGNIASASQPNEKQSELEKRNATLQDAGQYICQRKPSDPNVDDGSGFYVTVFVIKVEAEDVQMEEGESSVLQCNAKNITGTHAKWFRNDKEITSDNTKYEIFPENNTLVILKSSYDDVGPYECQFEPSSDPAIKKTVNLNAAPHVKHFDRSKNLVQGDNLLLECKASGFPEMHVKWYKGSEEVEEGGRVVIEDTKKVKDATLRINDLTFDDRADYTCEAINTLGSQNSTITVRVKDKLAALWPFLGICAEVAILCLIIFIYERRRAKKLEEEEMQENATHDMTNSNDHKGKDEVRQRK